jgi:uncharacterized protein (TIGR03437 family)
LWDPLISGLLQHLPGLAANPRLRFYGIIDKGTFSSGLLNAMSLKQPLPPELAAAAVTVVGEGAGGQPAGYGEIVGFTLPGSRLNGHYSTRFFESPSYIPNLPSFFPDIAVPNRSTDYFARHDPAMALILARATAVPAAPSGTAIAVNGASYRSEQGIAPGSFAAIFGSFGQTPDAVTMGGQAAQIVSAAASQINVLVPAALATGPQRISVQVRGTEVAGGQVTITAAGPGLFVLDPADISQAGAVENEDYRVNDATLPAAPGSILQIFATGYANPDPSRATQVYVGGVPAQIAFNGTVSPGLWQINAVVPPGATGQLPLFVTSGGVASNAVTVQVK